MRKAAARGARRGRPVGRPREGVDGRLPDGLRRRVGRASAAVGDPREASSFANRCSASTYRTVPDRARITIEYVVAPSGQYFTPRSSEPSVIPVAAKKTSCPATRSSVVRTRSMSYPASSSRCRSSSLRGNRRPWIAPPRHFRAAAAIDALGRSADPEQEVDPRAPASWPPRSRPATSPSVIRKTRAPTSRTRGDQVRRAGRGRGSRRRSPRGARPSPSRRGARSPRAGAVMSIASAASGPVATFSM